MEFGLFEVVPGIYQVRGFDLANVSFVKGDTGWIVIDPLTVKETSRAALLFVNEKLGERPVVVKFDNWLRSCRAPKKKIAPEQSKTEVFLDDAPAEDGP